MKIRDIEDVAKFQMCTGCGACAYMSPDEIEMVDVLELGRRPRLKNGSANDPRSEEALRICPGIGLEHDFDEEQVIPELAPAWGPVLELFEGHAADDDIRFAASSGGAATALAAFCIEEGGMHGTLHINSRPDVPYLNQTNLSENREGLLQATGSRYAPASPCDSLQQIEDAPAPCVMIGKPCDIAAAQRARKLRPALDEKLGVTIAIFCAGTPSTKGTLEMLAQMGVTDLSQLHSVRYRGRGWPGNAAAQFTDAEGTEQRNEMTYADSWGGILEKHRQWRCYLCLDHTGEFADIAVGDPWHRPIPPGETGRSLILARTERGREILHNAIAAGYLVAVPSEAASLPASQTEFEALRGKIWGRLLALRSLGAATPTYRNMPMFRFWWRKVGLMDKIRSILGTWRRVFRKKLRKPVDLTAHEPTFRKKSAPVRPKDVAPQR